MPQIRQLNPFAAELRRAAAAAAAPDKAPSRRELARVSGVGKTAIADWLAGKSIPRSWDDGAVLLVDAIIKLAARYGKGFPDEDAVRQRCMDAYYNAKSAQEVNDTPNICTTAPVTPAAGGEKVASQHAAGDEPAPVESVPESSYPTFSARGWHTKRTAPVVAVFAMLTIAAALILWWWSPIDRRGPAPAANLPLAGIPWHPTPLVSAKSGKCVAVDGDADEARAFLSGCTGTPGRLWNLRPTAGEVPATPLYHIVNPSNGKCLSYSEGMFGGARVVVQRSCAIGMDKGQLWNFVTEGNRGDAWTYGVFVNMQSSLLLDINGEEVEDGTPVIQWWENGKQNQRFRVTSEVIS